jgi:hypothetical protein
MMGFRIWLLLSEGWEECVKLVKRLKTYSTPLISFFQLAAAPRFLSHSLLLSSVLESLLLVFAERNIPAKSSLTSGSKVRVSSPPTPYPPLYDFTINNESNDEFDDPERHNRG